MTDEYDPLGSPYFHSVYICPFQTSRIGLKSHLIVANNIIEIISYELGLKQKIVSAQIINISPETFH